MNVFYHQMPFHMMSMGWFGMLLMLGLIGLAVLFLVFLFIIVLVRVVRGKPRQAQSAEETRMIQEMHRELGALSKRVESLETILMEHPGSKERD